MSILDAFTDMMVPGTPSVVTLAPDSSGSWVEDETAGTELQGIFWLVSEVPAFYVRTWMTNLDGVFATKDVTGISKGDYLTVNSIKYTIQTIQDPILNNVTGFDNIYLVGLDAKA